MKVFWQDQAEYYFVCDECYDNEYWSQWGGSTRVPNWKDHKKEVYAELKEHHVCEWCKKKEGSP